jgi:hypothetical protein
MPHFSDLQFALLAVFGALNAIAGLLHFLY